MVGEGEGVFEDKGSTMEINYQGKFLVSVCVVWEVNPCREVMF